jgi:hypothetical protein
MQNCPKYTNNFLSSLSIVGATVFLYFYWTIFSKIYLSDECFGAYAGISTAPNYTGLTGGDPLLCGFCMVIILSLFIIPIHYLSLLSVMVHCNLLFCYFSCFRCNIMTDAILNDLMSRSSFGFCLCIFDG